MAGERVWDGEGEMVTSWPTLWGTRVPHSQPRWCIKATFPGAGGLLHSIPMRVIPPFPFPFDLFPLFFYSD